MTQHDESQMYKIEKCARTKSSAGSPHSKVLKVLSVVSREEGKKYKLRKGKNSISNCVSQMGSMTQHDESWTMTIILQLRSSYLCIGGWM